MTLTIDKQTIELPAPVRDALEADAKAQARPVADVLAERLTTLYTESPAEIPSGATSPGAEDADRELKKRVRQLHSYGLLAGSGLSSAALLEERRAEVEQEYGAIEEYGAKEKTAKEKAA